ncbi:MAG: glycosyl hydrolase repeat-containing glycosyl hydrolase [Pedosphaera sp.]|nr:glycosyl hydrolase repeat-containing glycosyl hydrolase [Pedosphaera sp.]
MKTTLVIIGTKKGVFLFTSTDRQKWQLHGPFQNGREINHAIYDPRSGRIYATANDAWFGCEMVSSPDLGKTWENATLNPVFPENSGLKLERLWHIEPGPLAEPNVLYAGVAPAALFRSTDFGKTWHELTGLTTHPSRPEWHPGAGGLCLHSIVVDPLNPKRLFVGISAVGVFRSEDAGETWKTANRGTRAEFRPDKYPEYGQCVHKLLMADSKSSLLFQQNHCGVYRSADAGENWQEITAGLPSDFGFPLAIHPRQPETIYVIPLKGAEFRCPPDNKLRVFRSRDAGKSWNPLTNGLPQIDAFNSIYREGMAVDHGDPAGIYFGTNNGKVFSSHDEGDSWQILADNLPPVFSVATATLNG